MQGRGFRQIPQIYKIFHVVVNDLIKKNELNKCLDNVGLISAYEYANLDSNIDFEYEIMKYGVSMVNPIKAPFTVCNSCAGWLAIKNRLQNINLTVSSGRTSLLSAIKIATHYINSGRIDYCMVLSANLNHGCYKIIDEQDSFMKGEFASAILISNNSNINRIYEIESVTVNALVEDNEINSIINSLSVNEDTSSYNLFDGKVIIDKTNIHSVDEKLSNRYQCCYLPVLLQNIESNIPKSCIHIRYLVYDSIGSIGSLTLKK